MSQNSSTIDGVAQSTLCDLLSLACDRGNGDTGLVDTDSSTLTWEQVRTQAQNLASHLVAGGLEPGERVALIHPRSSASFIAVHAILAAGGVMVPLDPFGPQAGLSQVLAAVEPRAVIGTTKTLTARIPDFLASTTALVVHHGDREPLLDAGVGEAAMVDFQTAVAESAAVSPWTPPGPHDPAYIIFTSGSTGTPKGIVHTHASGMAYAEMGAVAHAMTANDRLASISPLHFDQSTLDLYAVPFVGATAIAISEVELRFPANLTRRLADDRATMIYTTPYQLLQMAHRGDLDNRDLTTLRQIAFGGEAFAPNVLVELGQTFPPAELLNVYGPAEVNGVTVQSFGIQPEHIEHVSIGQPCEGVRIHIVDDQDQPVAPGQSGEMLVHSPTAMDGYWRRQDLNAACFTTIDGRRYYRTGDRAHLDAHGLLQFEGRLDNRIKVRGVRIELEEIERVLEDADGIAHAVAGLIDDANGVQQIAAWVVLSPGHELAQQALTSRCRERLPANAVPTQILVIDSVPTTATGKIDRATLRSTNSLDANANQ